MPTLSADGDTAIFEAKGKTHLHLSGSFGGGTFQVKFKDSDGTYRDLTNGTFTAAADKLIEFTPTTTIKGTLSGATGPTLVYNFK